MPYLMSVQGVCFTFSMGLQYVLEENTILLLNVLSTYAFLFVKQQ